MKVTPIKTPVVMPHDDLLAIIKESIPTLKERSVLVVTSKVVSLWEGATKPRSVDKDELIKEEAELYLAAKLANYNYFLTVRHGLLAVSSGIDESNVKDIYVLLPEDPFASAARIWHFLRETYGVKEVGVVISDSISMPLKWGTMGRSIAYCGIEAVVSLIGRPDLHGRPLEVTRINLAEGLAAAAVMEMGEADEAMPLVVIEDTRQVRFVDHSPTPEELAVEHVALEDDFFGEFLMNGKWEKGGKAR